jgi:DNA-binding NtrC family response regulator
MSRKCRILLIDDHDATRETIAEVLEDTGHTVSPAENMARALEHLEANDFDLILTDLKLPDGDGMRIMEKSKSLYPATPIVMITGHGSIENAIEATKLGAYEYLTKPVDLNKLRVIVANALHLVQLERKVVRASALEALIGQSAKMAQVREQIRQVAQTDATVLIQGESGTGKELVANAIQSLSRRAGESFVKVNVAALTKELIESELFGHEKGAFSGAIRQRKGRFELADGGTIFLDEIGEMRLDLQVKLLRTLQEQEIDRVGGTETIPVDCRVIAATNRDLKAKVQAGEFREDLYFRLNVFRIAIPPLRERPEDVPLLAGHFLHRFAARYETEKQFSDEALRHLQAYDWPGNARELENAVESSFVRAPGSLIEPAMLPEEISGLSPVPPADSPGLAPGLTIEQLEKQYIYAELARFDGNKTHAAKSLGIGLKTLYRKLEAYES